MLVFSGFTLPAVGAEAVVGVWTVKPVVVVVRTLRVFRPNAEALTVDVEEALTGRRNRSLVHCSRHFRRVAEGGAEPNCVPDDEGLRVPDNGRLVDGPRRPTDVPGATPDELAKKIAGAGAPRFAERVRPHLAQ